MPEFIDISEDSTRLLSRYGVSDADFEILRANAEVFLSVVERVVDEFYDWLETQREDYDEFFSDPNLVVAVKKLQRHYWKTFFTAEFNEEYLDSRKKLGNTHAFINLTLNSYFSAMNRFQMLWMARVHEENVPDKDHLITALVKRLNLDCGIVAATYNARTNKKIEDQNEALMEMSTPVTVIWDRILLLPIVGILDSKRTLDMMDSILKTISTSQSIVILIDISGVAVVDTAVANHLIKVTQATRLMGCETIISGISPTIAHTIVDLGIKVKDIRTTATLKDALSMALEKVDHFLERNPEQ